MTWFKIGDKVEIIGTSCVGSSKNLIGSVQTITNVDNGTPLPVSINGIWYYEKDVELIKPENSLAGFAEGEKVRIVGPSNIGDNVVFGSIGEIISIYKWCEEDEIPFLVSGLSRLSNQIVSLYYPLSSIEKLEPKFKPGDKIRIVCGSKARFGGIFYCGLRRHRRDATNS